MTHCREPSGGSTGLLQLCIYCLYTTNPEIHSIYFCLTPFVCEYNNTCQPMSRIQRARQPTSRIQSARQPTSRIQCARQPTCCIKQTCQPMCRIQRARQPIRHTYRVPANLCAAYIEPANLRHPYSVPTNLRHRFRGPPIYITHTEGPQSTSRIQRARQPMLCIKRA